MMMILSQRNIFLGFIKAKLCVLGLGFCVGYHQDLADHFCASVPLWQNFLLRSNNNIIKAIKYPVQNYDTREMMAGYYARRREYG